MRRLRPRRFTKQSYNLQFSKIGSRINDYYQFQIYFVRSPEGSTMLTYSDSTIRLVTSLTCFFYHYLKLLLFILNYHFCYNSLDLLRGISI